MKRYISSLCISLIVYSIFLSLIFFSFLKVKEEKKSLIKTSEKMSLSYIEMKQVKTSNTKEHKVLKKTKVASLKKEIKVNKKYENKKILYAKKTQDINKDKKKTKVLKTEKKLKVKMAKKAFLAPKSKIKMKKGHIEQISQKPIKSLSKETKKSYLSKNLVKIREEIKKVIFYPKRAKRFELEDIVNIRFTLLNTGEIKNIKVLSGHKFFKSASIQIIKKAAKNFPRVQKELIIDLPLEYKLI